MASEPKRGPRRREVTPDGIAYETCDPEPTDPKTKEAINAVVSAAVEHVRKQQANDLAVAKHLLQRIRAGWLPHPVGPDKSWWWGRPRSGGFELWIDGQVPSMSVVDRMTDDEIRVWRSSLHPMAAELVGDERSADGNS